MNLKFVFLWLFFAFSSLGAIQEVERELPRDRVLSLREQGDLFVRAYEEVGPDTLHPLKTVVPELAPMIRMHYSYVREFVEEHSPAQLPLLKQLWQKTSKVIEDNQVTVERMKLMAIQLAILLSEAQGTSEVDEIDRYLPRPREQSPSDNWRDGWKDLDSLKKSYIYGGDFPSLYVGFGIHNSCVESDAELRQGAGFCEAILCCPKGGFSYDRFVRNFISRAFPMKISALPFNIGNGGVHGGHIQKSTEFLKHEFTHTNEVASHIFDEEDRVKKYPQVLEQYPSIKELGPWVVRRDIFRKVYNSPHNPERNKAALFLMLHENHSSIINLHSWLGEENVLPFCERRLFWNLVANAINWPFHLEGFFIGRFIHPHTLNVTDSPLTLLLKIEDLKVEKDHTNFHLCLDCRSSDDQGDSKQGAPSLKPNIGTFAFDIAYPQVMVDVPTDEGESPSPQEMREMEVISNISDIAWNDPENILTEAQKKSVEKKMKENFSQQATRFQSREYFYHQFMMDDERKIREIYGEDFLPPETAPLEERAWAMDQAMKKFWTDFYVENKELFSVMPF